MGFKSIASSFEEVVNEEKQEDLEVIPHLPDVYKKKCFKMICQQPVEGLFGFMAFRN